MNNTENIKNNTVKPQYTPMSFNYIGKGKIYIGITIIILIVGFVSFFVKGFNWDIDFAGGTILQYNLGIPVDAAVESDIRGIVSEVVGDKLPSVTFGGTDGMDVIIKTLEIDTVERETLFERLSESYNINAELSTSRNISPTVGSELTKNTIMSVAIATFLMLIYITIRFDFLSGLSTVLCLLHDLFIMLTFYSLLSIPMNTAVIAAFLTILAYSINATIIIFDRVRENVRLYGSSGNNFPELCNKSVNQTFTRSLNTTITTLITLVMVYILGVPSIREFVLPLIIGIISGLYSSLCMSTSLWNFFTKHIKIRGLKGLKRI